MVCEEAPGLVPPTVSLTSHPSPHEKPPRPLTSQLCLPQKPPLSPSKSANSSKPPIEPIPSHSCPPQQPLPFPFTSHPLPLTSQQLTSTHVPLKNHSHSPHKPPPDPSQTTHCPSQATHRPLLPSGKHVPKSRWVLAQALWNSLVSMRFETIIMAITIALGWLLFVIIRFELNT